MKITFLAVIPLFCLLSCVEKKVQTKESYNLVASDKQLLFALDPNTKTFILVLFLSIPMCPV